MSEPLVPEPLRLALVAEGITDFVVIRAAISSFDPAPARRERGICRRG